MELPLKPVPSGEWRREFGHLMGGSEWLRKKLDRERRMREHFNYLVKYASEVLAMVEPGMVLDLGPGPGELLEIAAALGHTAIGLDASDEDRGGMGNAYVKACRLLHERQGLEVYSVGIDRFLLNCETDTLHVLQFSPESCCFINSRGSLEQMFADCMDGPPHNLHHDCRKLSWHDDAYTRVKMRHFIAVMAALLRPGGVLLIHANGAANTEVGDMLLDAMSADAAPELEQVISEERLHKWVKKPDGALAESTAAAETDASEPAAAATEPAGSV